MNSYDELITLIDSCINRNGVQAITGQVLNGVLKAMVNQLGAGYALGGVAHPSDDPGLPEEPVCYFASEVGTYTDFGGVSIVAGELALLCYDLTDGWRKETMYEGFASVGATIDGNVGTPSVDVTYNNGVLSFDFRNLKGNPGEDGDDGAAAGFGTIGATVDGNVGTPSVSVQESGPNTAKNLQFNFSNLKGETGVTSVVVTVDNTVGTPQCAVSLSGQVLTLAFTGLKGAQGDTGSSVDYPFTIVNNLTTNDPTQALSAAMGVQLESEITQLEHKLSDGITEYTFAYSKLTAQQPNISLGQDTQLYLPGDFVEIKANSNGATGAMLRRATAYNQPGVRYTASNTLVIRMTYAADNFVFQNQSVNANAVQTIKILIVSVSADFKNWGLEYYLDGTKIGDQTITTSGSTQYLTFIGQIGYNSVADIYYVKIKSNGVETEYTKLAEIVGAVGVTDIYTSESFDGLVGLNERLSVQEAGLAHLAEAVERAEGADMYFVFRKVSGLYNCESDFYVYQRLKGNIYSKIAIALYVSTGDKPNGYWRVERTNLVSIDEYGVETLIQSQAIVAGENEFVLQWLAGSGYNYDWGYTGGFHYGETIKNVAGAWVEFVADGNVIDTSADIPLTPCKTFYYREYSPIYQHNDGTIAAWHLKETKFNDGGYEVVNDVKFVQALDYFAYPGIVCVSRYLSEYAMPENVATITDMGDGEPTQTEQFKSNGHRIHYEGNGYATDVFSEFRAGADDSLCQRVVYNSTAYNKYYRRNPDTPGSIDNRLVAFTKVTIKKM